MAEKIRPKPRTIVRATTHPSETRPNIPTAELESSVRPEEQRPTIVRYARDTTLDPPLVWKGKHDQDADDLKVPAVPIYIGETTTRSRSSRRSAPKARAARPTLLVVSDLERIEIRTNFTGLSRVVKTVTLDDLAGDDPSAAPALLRDVFVAPEQFCPRIEPAQITEKAARHFAEIAQSLRFRGNDPEHVADFLE